MPPPSVDDLGTAVDLDRPPVRVVSLVPSLTEAIAETLPGLLVGATAWCSHPADLAVERIGGTKNPDVERIAALRPHLVVANAEENRAEDIAALRERGLAVWVTAPTTVPAALDSLSRMLAACGMAGDPTWLTAARGEWADPLPAPWSRAVIPIWRRPWMAVGRDTFAGDVLARLGVANCLGGHEDRYPRISPADMLALGPSLVVLPDEPYAFTAEDGPEAFPGIPAALVNGRDLTWYGPSLATARGRLAAALSAAREPEARE